MLFSVISHVLSNSFSCSVWLLQAQLGAYKSVCILQQLWAALLFWAINFSIFLIEQHQRCRRTIADWINRAPEQVTLAQDATIRSISIYLWKITKQIWFFAYLVFDILLTNYIRSTFFSITCCRNNIKFIINLFWCSN